MTQKTELLSYLKKGLPVTRAVAFNKLGIAELSSRIGELQADGHVIEKQWLDLPRARVMQYTLGRGDAA